MRFLGIDKLFLGVYTIFSYGHVIQKGVSGMRTFIKVIKALSDPNRVKILKLLEQRVLCVCELQAALKIAQSTVSKHLKILEDADLVTYEKQGLWVNYRLNKDTDNVYAKKMLELLQDWLNEDENIKKLVLELKDISRDKIIN